MKIEEIYKRIMVCEKKERDFLEVGNTRTANRYHNEIQKWEELLNQLNPKMEKELNEYRRGYYKQKEVIDKAIDYIENHIKYECDIAYNGMQFYSYHLYDFNKQDLLDILKEVSEWK